MRRGVMLASAVMLLAFISVAILAITALFATELRRTRNTDVSAQQHQLIMAGVVIAAQDLSSSQMQNAREITLPHDMTDARLTLSWDHADAQSARATLTATYRNQNLRQQITWQKDRGQWQIINMASAENTQSVY